MGDSADNIYVNGHKLRATGAGSSTYTLKRHLGNQSIDTTSDACSSALWEAFRDASLNSNDASMDDAGNDAWGSWYDDNIVTPGNRTALRGLITEMCA